MKVKIKPFTPFGEVVAPPSKSIAHRLLISASLKKGQTIVKNIGNSADIIATVNCLNRLGANIETADGNAIVNGIERVKKGSVLDCNESGSSLRFLMPIACALGADCTFTGSQKLLSRPNLPLIDEIKRHGVKNDGFKFWGELNSGEYKIDGGISSQYISGLLFALPLLDGDSTLEIVGDTVSKDYISITLSVLEKSCIKFQKLGNKFVICGNQEYNLPKEVTVEGDWSGSAYPLTLGAIGGQVCVKGLDLNSLQGDRKIIEILEKAGAKITVEGDKITVTKHKLNGFEYSFEDIPDIAPVCAGLASACEGESALHRIERLKIKESDRVKTTLKTLKTAGISAKEDCGSIKVLGNKINGGIFYGENDHRIVMLASILSAVANGESEIIGAEAVAKSYPEFFQTLKKLGGDIDVSV